MKRLFFLVLFCCQLLSLSAQKNEAKPWTYWWWMGSAVNETDISYQLNEMAKSGLGGVHVIPIYGVKGYENQQIDFLSKRWLEVFEYTVQEASHLGMGVDLSLGTGWPFGGPNVPEEFRAKQLKLIDDKPITQPTNQKVKRAAPGGEGFVIDYFSAAAFEHYALRFDSTVAKMQHKPRAIYNDSYEAYGANWTNNFLEEFKNRRGYDFSFKQDTPPQIHDYNETISDLVRDGFTQSFADWGKKYGFKTRNQAHGSPANLLDLYALVDIPETEAFGSKAFNIPLYRTDPDYEENRFGRPSVLTMKMASSAAHLYQKPLVSSETSTWLGNHFKVSLSMIKPEIDELFTAGINHIFYHGTTYSPRAEGFPGWLFYASTNFGLQSHLWSDMPELNRYVTNVQTELQTTKPDNDVLLYFPVHDIWRNKSTRSNGVHLMDVHFSGTWLNDTPFGKIAQQLWDKGVCFDYVSDLQLAHLLNGKIKDLNHKTILIPPTKYLPENTKKILQELDKKGFTIRFIKEDIGLTELHFSQFTERDLARNGLKFIRKRGTNYTFYFITNADSRFNEGIIKLSKATKNIELVDPMTGKRGGIKQTRDGFYVQLKPGQSMMVFAWDKAKKNSKWKYEVATQKSIQFVKNWTLKFPDQEPIVLKNLTSWTTVGDTTKTAYFSGKAIYENTFELKQKPESDLTIQLGDVRETAEVFINGTSIGRAWALPFDLTIDKKMVKVGKNDIKIVVQNLSANAVRKIEQDKKPWKKFYDINIVDIQYKPFDASKWSPSPSGLLTEVIIRGN